MAYQFSGEQTCAKCGYKYQWVTTYPERGEVVIPRYDPTKSNVKNCNRINQTNHYSVEIECPECWHREHVEVIRE